MIVLLVQLVHLVEKEPLGSRWEPLWRIRTRRFLFRREPRRVVDKFLSPGAEARAGG